MIFVILELANAADRYFVFTFGVKTDARERLLGMRVNRTGWVSEGLNIHKRISVYDD